MTLKPTHLVTRESDLRVSALARVGIRAGVFDQQLNCGGGHVDQSIGKAATPVRILMLSWEYPPVVVGGLGRHVHALATSLVRAGHEVTVVTRHAPGAPLEEYAE